MAYRDDVQAAVERITSLEQALAEARVDADQGAREREILRERLMQAERALAERGVRVEPSSVGPSVNHVVVRVTSALAIVGTLGLAAASYRSERGGMLAAQIALPLWGAFAGAWLRSTRTTTACLVSALVGAVTTLLVLNVFFATLWHAL